MTQHIFLSQNVKRNQQIVEGRFRLCDISEGFDETCPLSIVQILVKCFCTLKQNRKNIFNLTEFCE
jgi:hypothetical protein